MQKSNVQIPALDARLLRFLQLLLQTGSVTRAGTLLGISQPAASRMLARLRDLTGDPILVRTQKGYQLTDHARSRGQLVLDAITSLDAVFQKPVFDPGTANVSFRVAATDYAVACVLGPVMREIAEHAPNMRMDVLPLVSESFAMLDDAELDFILYASVDVKGDYIVRKIYDDSYAVVFRDGHPLAKKAEVQGMLEPQDLEGYRKIEFVYPTQHKLRADTVLRMQDESNSSAFSIPYYTAMPFVVAGSDAVAPVPARLAELLAGFASVRAVPYRPGEGFSYYLIWHVRAQHNPAMRWLSKKIDRACNS